jgi:class III poly(R)-hydroxyalkanoic acid synthase PhaC subunit
MMHLHMKNPRTTKTTLPFDPLAAAFKTGQEIYKSGLIEVINSRRRMRGREPLAWPAVGTTARREQAAFGPARLYRYGANDANAQNAIPGSSARPVRVGGSGAEPPTSNGSPLVVVCSLINKPYVLDLLPERSVFRRLLDGGRDVWLLDWGVPGEPGVWPYTLADYALDLLPRAVAEVKAQTGSAAVDVLGYCMGGTMALAAAGAGALDARALVLMATPVDLHDDGMLSIWSRAPGFDARAIVAAYGHAPPHLLQPAFKMLDPVGLATKLIHLEDKIEDDAFVRFFLAMETWLEDSAPFPGGAFADWLGWYRDNALVAKGGTILARQKIEIAKVKLPILSLVAEGDTITPPVSSLAIERAVPKAQHTIVRQPGGHIGLATSTAAHKKLWPEVARWLGALDSPQTKKVRAKGK